MDQTIATPDRVTLYTYRRISFSDKFKNNKNSFPDDQNVLFATNTSTGNFFYQFKKFIK